MSQKNFSRIKEKLIQLKGKSLRNSLFIWLYVLLVSFAVQVVVLGMTKFSLYNEGEYLFYPENWLVSIKSNNKIKNIINGGRYDQLISDLGSKTQVSAVGAALNLNY